MQATPHRRPILICEDDEDIRELLIEAIQAEGFEVRVARNGREVLACLEQQNRYLLLLDLMMPVMSGYQVLERLAADHQLRGETLVIILSATGFIRPLSPQVLEKRLVKATIQKPFELDELLSLLDRLA